VAQFHHFRGVIIAQHWLVK